MKVVGNRQEDGTFIDITGAGAGHHKHKIVSQRRIAEDTTDVSSSTQTLSTHTWVFLKMHFFGASAHTDCILVHMQLQVVMRYEAHAKPAGVNVIF